MKPFCQGDCNRLGERERDLIPKDSYLSQSQRDSSPLSENRSNVSSVRNENKSQSSRDASPASGSSPSIDGYSPHTLRDVSPQERQRDVTPPRAGHKSLTSRDSGQQSRVGNTTPTKNTHTQERQKDMSILRDQKSASKRRRHPPDRELHDKYRSHQPRSDSPPRERNFSHKDISPRQRRRSAERSLSPPRGKLRDHLHQQGRHPQPRARHDRDPPRRRHSHKPHRSIERSPPRTQHRDLTPPTGRFAPHDISPSHERYDKDPNPPGYSWEPNPTRDRARHDRDLHKYGREPNPYRERDRYDRNSSPLRERDRYHRDHYPLSEKYDKYEGEFKLPHRRYDRPTPGGPSPGPYQNTAMIPGGCVDPIFRDIQIHHPNEIVIMVKCPGSHVIVIRRRVTITISTIRMRIVGVLTKKRGGRTTTDILLCRGNQQSSTVAAGIRQFSIYFSGNGIQFQETGKT